MMELDTDTPRLTEDTGTGDEFVLQMDHVSVHVPDGEEILVILDDLSLRLRRGELVAVTGSSGSGKSTLMAVAGLLRRPQSGTVNIAGRPTVSMSNGMLTRIRREQIGLVFQSSNLFPSLTALEQLEFVAHVAGDRDSSTRSRAEELLDSVGLSKRRNARPGQLSGGERQRVGIARALMNEPTILLADEPTASLDDARGREIMAILTEQAHIHGVATLVVTHAPRQIPQAGRRLDLLDGALVEQVDIG